MLSKLKFPNLCLVVVIAMSVNCFEHALGNEKKAISCGSALEQTMPVLVNDFHSQFINNFEFAVVSRFLNQESFYLVTSQGTNQFGAVEMLAFANDPNKSLANLKVGSIVLINRTNNTEPLKQISTSGDPNFKSATVERIASSNLVYISIDGKQNVIVAEATYGFDGDILQTDWMTVGTRILVVVSPFDGSIIAASPEFKSETEMISLLRKSTNKESLTHGM